MDDADTLRGDAQLIGNDLRQSGAQALAMRGGADPRFDEPRWIHPHLDGFPAGCDVHPARRKGRRAVAGAFGEGAEPYSDKPAAHARLPLTGAEAGKADRFHRDLQCLPIACRVEYQAGRGPIWKSGDEIAPAQFARLDAELGGCFVH